MLRRSAHCPGLLPCCLVVGLVLAGGSAPAVADELRVTMASGAAHGQAHAVASGLAALIGSQPESVGLELRVLPSDGPLDNLRLLRAGQAQFAILPAMLAAGAGSTLGAAATLWRDPVQVVLPQSAVRTGTLDDLIALRGQPFWFGQPQAASTIANRLLLLSLGLDLERDYQVSDLPDEASALGALRAGRLKGMAVAASSPAAVLRGAFAAEQQRPAEDPLQLLDFTDAHIAAINDDRGLWTSFMIPAGTYAGQDEDVHTAAQANLLVVRSDVDAATVRAVVTTIFNHLDLLRGADDALYQMSLDRAILGVTIPLHPGAADYYAAAGVLAVHAEDRVAAGPPRGGPLQTLRPGAVPAAVGSEPASPPAAPTPGSVASEPWRARATL